MIYPQIKHRSDAKVDVVKEKATGIFKYRRGIAIL